MAMASKNQLCGVLAEHEPAAGPGKEPAEKERAFQLAGHPSPSVYCEARGKSFMRSASRVRLASFGPEPKLPPPSEHPRNVFLLPNGDVQVA
jgi:hypothetical protein